MAENILSGKIVITAPGVQKVFNDLNQSTTSLIRSLKNDLDPAISKAFKSGVISVGNMKAALETLKENMARAINPAQIIRYNAAIKDLEVNIKKVSAAGIASGNALSAGFTKGFSALRTLAHLLPGIGIGGIVAFATTGIADFVSGLTKVKNAYNAAAVQAEVFKKANASIGDDVSRLNALVAVARDVSLSTQQRTNAIAELQKLYPNYLRNITLENINSSAAALAIDTLTRSLVSKAIAQAYSNKIAEESIKFDNLKTGLIDLQNAQLKDQLGFLQQKNKAEKDGGFLSKDIIKNQQLGQERYKREILETVKAVQAQDAAIDDLFKKTKLATAQSLDFIATPQLKKIKVEDIFNLVPGRGFNDAIEKMVLQSKAAFVIPISATLAPTLNVSETQKNLQAALSFFALKTSTLTIPIEVPKVPLGILKEMKESAENTARAVSDILAPAFADLFTAIIDGESPIKAFFDSIIQSINQVIQRLIAAAIQAAIFSIISGGGTSFGKAFTNILGGVGAGGQRTPGGIGFSNQAIRINLSGGFQVRGNDLVIAYNRTISSQGRTG